MEKLQARQQGGGAARARVSAFGRSGEEDAAMVRVYLGRGTGLIKSSRPTWHGCDDSVRLLPSTLAVNARAGPRSHPGGSPV